VQVKHARSDGILITLKCYSRTIQSGRVRSIKRYTAELIEWMAVWDASTGICCYVPASMLGAGRRTISLRINPPARRYTRIHMAADFRHLG